jgi:hypothetical protein
MPHWMGFIYRTRTKELIDDATGHGNASEAEDATGPQRAQGSFPGQDHGRLRSSLLRLFVAIPNAAKSCILLLG